MNRSEAKDTILSYFNTQWGSIPVEYIGTPVSFENIEFTKPEDQPWVRFECRSIYTRQHTMGATGHRTFTRYCMIIYQVFIPIGQGTYDGDQLCEEIGEIFEATRLGPIVFHTNRFREVGIDHGLKKEGVWYQFNGQIRYEFDQTK